MDMNQNGMPLETSSKKSYGPLVAVVIILGIIVIGSLYFLGQRMNEASYELPQDQSETVNSSETQSSSDEIADIEADLMATSLDNLDEGSTELEAELEAQ